MKVIEGQRPDTDIPTGKPALDRNGTPIYAGDRVLWLRTIPDQECPAGRVNATIVTLVGSMFCVGGQIEEIGQDEYDGWLPGSAFVLFERASTEGQDSPGIPSCSWP
ncbi:MAG TPA: hypothetical protein VJL08_03730 [Dehalococcoidia bacterium]|nr:hypothetical protein [Dehalococcoidia bacterium]